MCLLILSFIVCFPRYGFTKEVLGKYRVRLKLTLIISIQFDTQTVNK